MLMSNSRVTVSVIAVRTADDWLALEDWLTLTLTFRLFSKGTVRRTISLVLFEKSESARHSPLTHSDCK